jgi:uncharacterized protein
VIDLTALSAQVRREARPRSALAHLLPRRDGAQLFLANGSRIYEVSCELADRFTVLLEASAEASIGALIAELGLDLLPLIDGSPPLVDAPYAVSLAIAQKCNLGCTYCYAQQGQFGGAPRNMSLDTALRSVDWLLDGKEAGTRVNIAFLGGEPLQNREVLQATTAYASRRGSERGVTVGFSITTNGTLIKPADLDFFESHGFAVTISLDGPQSEHDRLRPLRNGRGSYERILERIGPLLKRQSRMQVSARVTVTPMNLNLVETLDLFIGMGFHSVGFSPLLRAPNGLDEMNATQLEKMLESMMACGLKFEQQALQGSRYPFLNMTNALRELHRGTHRPYPCGAGVGYFGISAEGSVAACHRFVGDRDGQFGDLQTGLDAARRTSWLGDRHVDAQSPCNSCWARYLCGGGCHHEVLARGRVACDYIRGWLHYTIQAYGRLSHLAPEYFGVGVNVSV